MRCQVWCPFYYIVGIPDGVMSDISDMWCQVFSICNVKCGVLYIYGSCPTQRNVRYFRYVVSSIFDMRCQVWCPFYYIVGIPDGVMSDISDMWCQVFSICNVKCGVLYIYGSCPTQRNVRYFRYLVSSISDM